MDDPIPIEGIIEGEPASLAAVCAAGGSAIVAYCSAVGAAETRVAETVVAALTSFRRGVVANANQEPSQLETLLLAATDRATRQIAGVAPSPMQQAAAQTALEEAVTEPLTPGLAPRIIRALAEAAPVTALGGDVAAVRRAAEDQYARMFDGWQSPAGAAPPSGSAFGWVPPEILTAPVSYAGALAAEPGWQTPAADPAGDGGAVTAAGLAASADAQAAGALAAPAAPAPAPEPEPEPPPGDAAPPPVRPPGTIVIKRGGHWPFRRRPRTPSPPSPSPSSSSHRGAAGGGRNLLVGAVVGLAAGAAFGVLAAPEKTVEQDPILVRPLDTPFTVDGAVFNVARTSTAPWARAIRRSAPRAGRTWLTLAAQTRNVRRANFHPRGLGYRLRTAAGIVVGPETALVAEEIPAVGGGLPIGKRTSVHLGFQVPRGARGLTLEFDPSPRSPRVRVPLN